MSTENSKFALQWTLKFAQMVADHVPATGYAPHTEIRLVPCNPGDGKPLKLTPMHSLLWHVLVMSAEDLAATPTFTTLSYGQIASLMLVSKRTCTSLLGDLQQLGVVYRENRGGTSNRTLIFYNPYGGNTYPPFPVRDILLDDVCFPPHNRSNFASHNPDHFDHRTQGILDLLIASFPDHTSLESLEALTVQRTVLQDCIATVARALPNHPAPPGDSLRHLIQHIVKYRDTHTKHAFDELKNTQTLAGLIRTRAPYWIRKYLRDEFFPHAAISELED
jgi:hypothetical protein